MTEAPLRLLLDTSAWLDYFSNRRGPRAEVAQLVQEAALLDAVLYCTTLSMKDVFFVHTQDMKRALQADGIVVDATWSAAVRESAWSCIRTMAELSLVVSVGQVEALQAMAFRPVHDDFEDDIVLATAQRASVDYLVTSDDQLAQRSPVACVSVSDMLALLRSNRASH